MGIPFVIHPAHRLSGPTMHIARLLLFAARIIGSLALAFLLFMLIGHLTGDANGPNGMVFNGMGEVVAFILFPVCTIIGLALAYKWELAGGLIAVGSILALVLLRTDLLRPTFLLMALPGLLYVALGAWHRRGRNAAR